MSLERLDSACHSGPIRSIAASTAVFRSSTIISSRTEPASRATSVQLRPIQKASGTMKTARQASSRNAASSQPARSPDIE